MTTTPESPITSVKQPEEFPASLRVPQLAPPLGQSEQSSVESSVRWADGGRAALSPKQQPQSQRTTTSTIAGTSKQARPAPARTMMQSPPTTSATSPAEIPITATVPSATSRTICVADGPPIVIVAPGTTCAILLVKDSTAAAPRSAT